MSYSAHNQHSCKSDSLDETSVIEYLKCHPDFFVHHAMLLKSLTIPHPTSKKVISLVERRMQLLQEQAQQLEDHLVKLTHNAQANQKLVKKLHELSLILLAAPNLKAVITDAQAAIKTLFDAECVVFKFAPLPAFINLSDHHCADIFKYFEKTLRTGLPQCNTQLTMLQSLTLYGEKASLLNSHVLIPLRGCLQSGLLAIGSQSPQRYTEQLDTYFLNLMSELIGVAMTRYLSE